MSDPTVRPSPPRTIAGLRRKAAGWLVGLATLVALAFHGSSRALPPLPAELVLQVRFPSGTKDRIEPVISAGAFGAADFLALTYVDETHARLSYDHWGSGGPSSAPFAFQPGRFHSLRVTFPPFTATRGTQSASPGKLRLVFDDTPILTADVPGHVRDAGQIFFGTNPIGGTTGGGSFRGEIRTADGQSLRGRPFALFSAPSLVAQWLKTAPQAALHAVFLSVAAAFTTFGLLTWFAAHPLRLPPFVHPAGHERPPHLWFLATATVCALAFVHVVTGGSFRLIYPEAFGNFYDYQAQSLLQGKLDVPEAAIGGEAFIYGGKYFGYFGPTPALLRLPFVLVGVGFGELSRSFLLAYYLACLAAVYALHVHAVRLLTTRPTWPARCDTVLLTAIVGLGTTLFFLGSRAYIYHEAILCGVACALWSGWFSLRWLEVPESRRWLPALLLGTLSVHARPPVGLFALTLLGCVAASLVLRDLRFTRLRRPFAIGLLSVAGVLSFNALSYAKFRTIDGCPLRLNVQYHGARLAHIEGKQFHVSNFRHNFDAYIWLPNVIFRPTFPYCFIGGRDSSPYPEAKIDMAEATLSLPFAQPAAVFLSVVGGLFAFVRWPGSRRPLTLLTLAALPMSVALFLAIAISHRYTADFVPALLLIASFALASIELLPPAWRLTSRCLLVTLTVMSILSTLAFTLHYQGEGVWGVPPETQTRYQELRKSADKFLGLSPP